MRELTKAKDRKLSGVAGGMAEYFEMDKTIVRAIWLFGSIVLPPLILAYFVLAMVMPDSAGVPKPQPEPGPEVIEMRSDAGEAGRTQFSAQPPRRRLVKSYDRWVSGVAGGIAEYFDVDPILVRALFLAAVFVGFGTGLLVYIILAIVMPRPEYQYR